MARKSRRFTAEFKKRVAMVERGGPLALARQCGPLGVSRSSQYYEPLGESAENLALMRRLDELHLAHPFHGSRQMARHLRREGAVVGRHRCIGRRAAPRCSGDLQYGLGRSIHQHRVHRAGAVERRALLHGRPRPLS